MSHPYQEHRKHKVEKSRVKDITKGYAGGGMPHGDVKADKALIRRMVKGPALRADGGPVTARADRPGRAKGGRVKGTTVNVIVAPKQDTPQATPAMPPMPPKPPMPPLAPAAAGAPPPVPGLGGMPPPPMPMRAKGGAVKSIGMDVGTKVQHSGNKNDTQNIGRKPVITKATGGAIYSDGRKGKQMAWLKGVGAGGGEGRLKKAHHAK